MALKRHIIRRQVVDVHLSGLSNAFDIQEKIKRLCNDKLSPAIENLLDISAGNQEVIRLDKVEINLGEIPFLDLETEFVSRTMLQLKENLSRVISERSLPNKDPELSSQEATLQLFLFFLRNGYFPWWAEDRTLFQLEKEINDALSIDVGFEIVEVLTENKIALERLVIQFSNDFINSLIQLFVPGSEVVQLLGYLQAASSGVINITEASLRKTYWVYLLPKLLNHKNTLKDLSYLLPDLVHTIAREHQVSLDNFILTLKGTRDNKIIPNSDFSSRLSIAIDQVVYGKTKRKENDDIPRNTGGKSEGKIQEQPPSTNSTNQDRVPHTEDQKRKTVSEKPTMGNEDQIPQQSRLQALKEKNDNSQVEPDDEIQSLNEVKKKQRFKEYQEENDTEIYIPYAGLILLHPFLSSIFREFELLIENNFKDDFARHKAVHFLAYLGSGLPEMEEHYFCLHKLLCAMPFSEPLYRLDPLTLSEKEKCEELLQAVIRHWRALKNTSAEGLRQTFLQREGKLVYTEQGWLLHVAQKSYDVLLDKLPWGISLIKLPWMPKLLHVEWA